MLNEQSDTHAGLNDGYRYAQPILRTINAQPVQES